MLSQFLSQEFCHQAELKDFFEWHQGISHYGFWAIEITDQPCLDQIEYCQQTLKPYLHPSYQRQPHIKLFASGLVAEHLFHSDYLLQQLASLIAEDISTFSLQLDEISSFSSCPYLATKDNSDILQRIRLILSQIKGEDSPCDYIPHITLGFYNHPYKTETIAQALKQIPLQQQAIPITAVIYAEYETSDIQGPYQVIHRLQLKDK